MSSQIITGETLQFTDDNKHAYAYSGLHTSNTTAFEVLNFFSGEGYIVGEIQLNSATDDDFPTAVNVNTANILFNGISIALLRAGTTTAADTPYTNPSISQKIIIPPRTTVSVIVDSNGTETDRYISIVFTGKVGMAPRVGNLNE
jgi:hypothetical protein